MLTINAVPACPCQGENFSHACMQGCIAYYIAITHYIIGVVRLAIDTRLCQSSIYDLADIKFGDSTTQ